MASAAQFRIEHVAKKPRGWRVRTVPSGKSKHRVRVAFPPGPRVKGSGKVLEILHPRDERNPECRINPGELLIFGNPEKGIGNHKPGCKCLFCKRAREIAEAGARMPKAIRDVMGPKRNESRYIRRSLHHQLEEAAKARGETIKLEYVASEGRNKYRYQGQLYTPGELADLLGVRWPNSKLEAQRAARDRAARIRGARANPSVDDIGPGDKVTILVPAGIGRGGQEWKRATGRAVMRGPHGWVINLGGPHGRPGIASDSNLVSVKKGKNPRRMQVFFDPGIKKYTAVFYDSKFGNLYASGYTKKQAAHALHDRVKEARRAGTHRNAEQPFVCQHCGKEFTAAQVEAGAYRKHLAEHRAQRQQKNPRAFAGWKHFTKQEKNFLRSIHMPAPRSEEEVRAYKESLKKIDEVNRRYRGNPAAGRGTKERKDLADQLRWTLHYMRERGVDPRSQSEFKRRRLAHRNPEEIDRAVQLYQSFHGKDPKEVVKEHVSAALRLDYTALGDLEYIKVITPIGQTVEFSFSGDGVKLASAPNGKQLYCIGGNQDVTPCLDSDSREKDFIDLGEAIEVQYLARKVHGGFHPVSYYHKFGEENANSTKPQIFFDKLKKQVFFTGGEYRIDTSKGVSPGIEN
jgi:hypothetical protein